MNIQVDDLIGVDGSGSFNHGCKDYAILRVNGDGTGTVVEAQSCHSCWQVGHDSDHVFAEIGQIWDINPIDVRSASDDWSTQVKWEM